VTSATLNGPGFIAASRSHAPKNEQMTRNAGNGSAATAPYERNRGSHGRDTRTQTRARAPSSSAPAPRAAWRADRRGGAMGERGSGAFGAATGGLAASQQGAAATTSGDDNRAWGTHQRQQDRRGDVVHIYRPARSKISPPFAIEHRIPYGHNASSTGEHTVDSCSQSHPDVRACI
jgi:hypothetical protein